VRDAGEIERLSGGGVHGLSRIVRQSRLTDYFKVRKKNEINGKRCNDLQPP
jgi:hypothetical protein